MTFERFIGVDYSGTKRPITPLDEIQVYEVSAGGNAYSVRPSRPPPAGHRKTAWSRKFVAEWLADRAKEGQVFFAGVDHAFSMPWSYFMRYRLDGWNTFLVDFARHWPTREYTVKSIRAKGVPGIDPEARIGGQSEFRLCERWTPSAKSVFQFGVNGEVATSTHAGIPWLKYIRDEVGDRVHFWPFDGWEINPNKAVIAEVYPALFKNRYPRKQRSPHEQDAYATAQWLADMAARGALARYLSPPLTPEERAIAEKEGWILGVG